MMQFCVCIEASQSGLHAVVHMCVRRRGTCGVLGHTVWGAFHVRNHNAFIIVGWRLHNDAFMVSVEIGHTR
jgi:hypothetical protein